MTPLLQNGKGRARQAVNDGFRPLRFTLGPEASLSVFRDPKKSVTPRDLCEVQPFNVCEAGT